MRKPSFLIYTEAGPGVGLGHVTRCSHLATALRQEGAEVWSWPDRQTAATGFLRSMDVFTNAPSWADVGVVDLMRWDEAAVSNLADRTKKLVVIIGAGQSSLARQAKADLLVYQTGWLPYGSASDLIKPPHLAGPDYLILDPTYANKFDGPRKDVLVCFGDAMPPNYQVRAIKALSATNLSGTVVVTPYLEWDESPIRNLSVVHQPNGLAELQRHHKVQIGSVGMSTYEAHAVGCFPITVGRSDDHVETGFRLSAMKIGLCLGRADSVRPEGMVSVAEAIVPGVVFWQEGCPKIDGFGAKRVARVLMELGQ